MTSKKKVDTLRKENVEIIKEPYSIGGGSFVAWAKDPDGVTLELNQFSELMNKFMNPGLQASK